MKAAEATKTKKNNEDNVTRKSCLKFNFVSIKIQ